MPFSEIYPNDVIVVKYLVWEKTFYNDMKNRRWEKP